MMTKYDVKNQRVFILGISSDIGKDLAKRYIDDGNVVFGTYRKKLDLGLEEEIKSNGGKVFYCDLQDSNNVNEVVNECRKLNFEWDVFISCVGYMEPIGPFFECDFDQWEKSIKLNTLDQMRFLHGMYSFIKKENDVHVVFFAGGGTNNPFKNYSAYCASKIMLIKMCELLDDENENMNVFIVGPGMVRTKIHEQTLKNKDNAGKNYEKTNEFLKDESRGTPFEDIYKFINWGINEGKEVCSGRNFSVVYDQWKNENGILVEKLKNDKSMYKLRRYRNEEIL